ALELRERFGIVGVVHNLESKSRTVVLEHNRELGSEAGFLTAWSANGKGERFGIPQGHARAPDGRRRQDQRQRDKHQHLHAVVPCNPRAGPRLCRRLWDFSAHGLYPGNRNRSRTRPADHKQFRKMAKKKEYSDPWNDIPKGPDCKSASLGNLTRG